MATITEYSDIENGDIHGVGVRVDELKQPLIQGKEHQVNSDEESAESGSIWMLLLTTLVAVCGSFEFGSCVGFSSPTQAAIREDLSLSLSQFSMFGSIITIGAMFGAITSGRIADIIGRKGAMRMSAVICIAGWLAIYLSEHAMSLDIGRFCTGYGIGVFSFVVPVFIGEIAPKNLRGRLGSLHPLMMVLGSTNAYVLGTIITWRTLALIGVLPCLVLLIGSFFTPESPRWLAKVGRLKEFEYALRKLRGMGADVSNETAEIQDSIDALEDLPKVRMMDLFGPAYIRPVIIAVGLMVCQQLGGVNGINFYVSEVFVAAGFSSGKTGTIAYALIQVPVMVIGALLIDIAGRRTLLLGSSAGMALGCFMTGLGFYLKGQAVLLECVPVLTVSGILIYISAYTIGLGSVPWVVMSEIFPIQIKAVAGSLAVLVLWFGFWIISYTFNYLMSWSSTGTFLIYGGFCLLAVVFVAKTLPETKGKTLKEIQALINTQNAK